MLIFSAQVSAETYQYDPAGRLTNVTYDDGSRIDYTYDNAGNITKIARKGPSVGVLGLPDINSNGFPDIAVLRVGSILAEIRDGQAGALLNSITFLDDGFTPITFAALPDSDGNGVAELAVLATRNSDGRFVVEMPGLCIIRA